MPVFRKLVPALLAALLLAMPSSAQRPVRVPDIGEAENAPSSVYYEKDYFYYSDDRLDHLDEPSLWKLSKNPNLEAIRFFWVPEEGEVLVVRVDISRAEDRAVMTFKRSTGSTEESWGTVKHEETRDLTKAELKELRFRFNFMVYWRFERDDPDDYANSPGPLWLFEAIEGTKYHAVHRQNPTMGETMRLGQLLLSFAGVEPHEVAWPKKPVSPSAE